MKDNSELGMLIANALGEAQRNGTTGRDALEQIIIDTLNSHRPYERALPEDIAEARDVYANEDDEQIMVDDDAGESRTDNGVWVQGWLWLAREPV